MPTAMKVEDFLAVEADLDRATEGERRFCDHHLVVRGVAFAAEAAAVGHRDHAHLRGRKLKHACKLPVEIVRVLRARIEHHPALAFGGGERRMLLDRKMRAAFVKEHVLEDEIGVRERLLDVAELVGLQAVDVPLRAIVVDARRRRSEGLGRARDRRKRPVLHFDVRERLGAGLLVARDDRRDRVPDVADFSARKRILVLRDRHDAEGNRKRLAREDEVHAGKRGGARDVHREDLGVRVRRAEQPAVRHARERQVVGKARLAGDLVARVHAPARLADDVHAGSRMRRAAASIASTICA
ncbi:MAG: hypothetical protein RML56_00490 [Burkholderiales bacterium]|nr:hypothetical protein [Burkholderiales bacterium]